MLSISDVTVTIAVLKPTPILGGFGKPLILGSSAAGKDFKNYADIDAVKVDYAASTEEYKAAFALFAQKIRLQRWRLSPARPEQARFCWRICFRRCS